MSIRLYDVKIFKNLENILNKHNIYLINVDFAIKYIENSKIDIEDLIINLFQQGRSIGFVSYNTICFNKKLIEIENEIIFKLGFSKRTVLSILSNVHKKIPNEIKTMEIF